MACDTIKIETLDADEVVSIVTAGPQGPSGAEAATLTTTGDLLYRAALANDRLPIGSEGQVLKVASGLPAWANESGAVTEVNGQTGAVTLTASDVGAAPATGISPSAITGTAVVDSDARLSDSRSPLAHAASHAAAGSDPLAPFDIGAQGIFSYQNITITGNTTLTAARAKIYDVSALSGTPHDLTLPTTGNQVGDIVALRVGFINGSSIVTIKNDTTTVGSLGNYSFRRYRFVNETGAADGWRPDIVPIHKQNLEDSEAVYGVLPIGNIPTGTGSTQVALGDHTHGNLTNDGKVGSTAGLPLKTGTAGVVEAGAFGTGAGEFAEGNHTHADLHTRSHAITSTSDHTAGNHKVFYSDGSGNIQELALGASGEVLTSNGATSAPSFAAASGGVSAVGASAADILSVSGSDLVADDPNADRLVMYDDSASKLTHATAGKGLSFDGTTLKSATAFPDVHISRGATYISYIGGAQTGNSSNITNTGPGYVIFSPVYVRASANYTTFSVIVAAAGSASSVGKMALYTIKPADATPDALVCESGTFAADSTGLKQPTMASTFVSEGWYYMAIGTDSTTNMLAYGDTMVILRCVFSGTAGTTPFLLDFSSKSYADLWPNPWNGTGTTFRNAFHPITSLT